MADLKKLTLEALRELARKSLGREHSRFRTKRELIEALTAVKERVASAAEKAARKLEGPAAGAKARRKGPGGARAQVAREKGPEERPARDLAAPTAGPRATPAEREQVALARPFAAGEAEPDPEGHMVARVAGEEAARVAPHPLTESALEAGRRPRRASRAQAPGAAPFDERLGELPSSYGDDSLVALPRDPRTLFIYWDHAEGTLKHALEGLAEARPELWIFAREQDGSLSRLRVVEFALESRSYYVHDLEPGRVYTAEIHLADRHGQEHLLPPRSNAVALPGVGPSAIVDDRFMRILWSEPLQHLLREAYPGLPFSEEVRAQLARLSDWSRFPDRAWGGSGAGGMGGRPSSPGAAPASPSSPTTPPGRMDGEGH